MHVGRLVLIPVLLSVLAIVGCTKQEDSGGSSGPGTGQLSAGCSVKKIFNGESCPEAVGPVVMLVVADAAGRAQASCTGTFITKQHILTAGHCNPAGMGTMYAITSKSFDPKKVSGVKVTGFKVHPVFASSKRLGAYDVAVASLERATTASTMPILASEKVKVGQGAYLFGFGLEENQQLSIKNGKSALAPESARVTVADVNETTILFGDKQRGACPGDSGGPAVVASSRGVSAVVGVTSGGFSSDCRAATLAPDEFAQIAAGQLSPSQIAQIKAAFPDGVPQDFYSSVQSERVANFIAQAAPGVVVQ